MIKKIALATTLLVSIANAEIKQSGFFVGLDASTQTSKVKYDNNAFGSGFTINEYSGESTQTALSYKLGYQYYFTRLYARVSNFDYKDSVRNKYTLKTTTYELNADYLPIFYMSKEKDWAIRGIVGFGMGYNSTKMENYDVNLLPSGMNADSAQDLMEYGYQVGVMGDFDFGLNVELGFRYRRGSLREFTDGQNEASLAHEGQEFYLGMNYLF